MRARFALSLSARFIWYFRGGGSPSIHSASQRALASCITIRFPSEPQGSTPTALWLAETACGSDAWSGQNWRASVTVCHIRGATYRSMEIPQTTIGFAERNCKSHRRRRNCELEDKLRRKNSAWGASWTCGGQKIQWDAPPAYDLRAARIRW
jgi:hypothetical protein